MKILILGYVDYITNMLKFLQGTPFLLDNHIDYIIAIHPKPSKIKTIKKYFKKFNINRLIYWIDLKLYSKKHKAILDFLFPPVDLSFLKTMSNIQQLEYHGLRYIKNLDQYDFFIICTFGEKVPDDIIKKPKCCTFNIHPSYLPKLRGGYPTYVDAYKNSKFSGTTIHKMVSEYDAGDIIIQKKYFVEAETTNFNRYVLSAKIAAELLNELHLNNFAYQSKPQMKNNITTCKGILKYKREIELMSVDDDVLGYLRANYAKHLMPFTHTRFRLSMFSIISAKKCASIENFPSKYIQKESNYIFVYKNNFYLKYFDNIHFIKIFIYKGQLISK